MSIKLCNLYKSPVSIAHNHVHLRQTHVTVDCLDDGTICMTYIPTKQTVDVLTKGLYKPSFEDMVNKLGMTNI